MAHNKEIKDEEDAMENACWKLLMRERCTLPIINYSETTRRSFLPREIFTPKTIVLYVCLPVYLAQSHLRIQTWGLK